MERLLTGIIDFFPVFEEKASVIRIQVAYSAKYTETPAKTDAEPDDCYPAENELTWEIDELFICVGGQVFDSIKHKDQITEDWYEVIGIMIHENVMKQLNKGD